MRPIIVLAAAGVALGAAPAARAQSSTVTGIGGTIEVNFTSGWTQDRADTAESAALYWADRLESAVELTIDISFTTLACTNSSGTLGAAGATRVVRDFTNAPLSNTWYPIALANALAGRDLNDETATGGADASEITATFNAALDDPNRESDCLNGADWHYGTTSAPSGTISFYDVVLHEIGHGLGVSSFANMATGALLDGRDDVYTRLLEDNSAGITLDAASATDAQRSAAAVDDGDLVWSGAEVTAATGFLTAGTVGSEALMYAPTTFRSGSSVSHFDTNLRPNELMEPSYTANPRSDLTEALLLDLGWQPANATPVITGQAALATDEDVPIEIQLADLTVTDADDPYPNGFSLAVQSGVDFTVSGSTITPALNFNGTLTATVTVNDGIDDSEPFAISISVNPVNDAPIIVAQQPLSVAEDTPLALAIGDVTIEDPDSTAFTLVVEAGDDYTFSGTTITPAANFNGDLAVLVRADDGTESGPVFPVVVTVTPVNDPPVLAAAATLSTPEDTPLTLTLADLVIDDPDSSAFALRVGPGTNYTVNATTIRPDLDFSGTLTVPVTVNDGAADSEVLELSVAVTPVNDAPVIVAANTLTTDEDTPVSIQLSDLTVADPDNAYPTGFSLRATPGANYAVSGGSTVEPASDFNGALQVAVVVNDGAADSAPFSVAVTVRPVNDPPVIVGQVELTTDEDTTLRVRPEDLVIEDPDDDQPTFRIEPGANYGVSGFDVTPARDFVGTLAVGVVPTDGTDDGPEFSLQIVVRPVNDPPVITASAIIATDEDTPVEITASDFTITDPDDESDNVTVAVRPGPNYTVSGNIVTPALDFFGTLQVEVVAGDGADEGPPFSAPVEVRPVNDPPVITGQRPVTARAGSPRRVTAADLIISDPDDEVFVVRVDPGAGYAARADAFTPEAGTRGLLDVTVVVSDGAADSPPFTLRASASDGPLDAVVEVDAVGLFTPRPPLTPPAALGLLAGPVDVTLERSPELFRPGEHLVTWKETDASGAEAFRDQRVWVHPRVSLSPGPELAEGTSGELFVHLNGPAPQYPLNVSVSVGGSATADDHDLASGVVTLEDGATSVALPISVVADGVNDDGEVIEVELGIVRNPAVRSARVVLRDANVAPFVTLDVQQAGAPRTAFEAGAGPAAFEATVVDEAEAPVRWIFPSGATAAIDRATATWASGAVSGEVVAEAVDDAGAVGRRTTFVRWLDAPLELSPADDFDGDGRDDAFEGAVDVDLDGWDDYADYWRLPNVVALGVTASGPRDAARVVEATPGVRLVRGPVGGRANAPGAEVTAAQLQSADVEPDASASYVEVIATELPRAGAVVAFVFPLSRPLGAAQTVRVQTPSGWFDLLEDDNDALASAPATDGRCPPPDADAWRRPVEPGHDCVRLSVEDGDVNDADGAVDRQIVLVAGRDPQARTPPPPTGDAGPVSPTDPGSGGLAAIENGCSCRATDQSSPAWLLIGLALLAVITHRRTAHPRSRR